LKKGVSLNLKGLYYKYKLFPIKKRTKSKNPKTEMTQGDKD